MARRGSVISDHPYNAEYLRCAYRQIRVAEARRLSVMARRRRARGPAHRARRSIPQEGKAPAVGPRRSPNLPCGATRQADTVNPRRSAAFAEVRRCRQGDKPFCLGRVVICRPHGEMNPPCPRQTALTSNLSPAPGEHDHVTCVLALTAAIWYNDRSGQPVKRLLIAYDH